MVHEIFTIYYEIHYEPSIDFGEKYGKVLYLRGGYCMHEKYSFLLLFKVLITRRGKKCVFKLQTVIPGITIAEEHVSFDCSCFLSWRPAGFGKGKKFSSFATFFRFYI